MMFTYQMKEEAVKEFSIMSPEQQDFLIKISKIRNLNKYVYISYNFSIFYKVNELFSDYKEDSYIIKKHTSLSYGIELEYIFEHIESLKPMIEQKELKEIFNTGENKRKTRL